METFTYAGLSKRLLAHNIDLIPILGFCYLASIFISHDIVLYIVCGVIYSLYHTGFEMSKWEATPGKRVMHLKVRDLGFQRASMLRILIRTLAKFLSLGLLFGGFTMINFNAKRQGLHDYIAGSIVLYEKESVNL